MFKTKKSYDTVPLSMKFDQIIYDPKIPFNVKLTLLTMSRKIMKIAKRSGTYTEVDAFLEEVLSSRQDHKIRTVVSLYRQLDDTELVCVDIWKRPTDLFIENRRKLTREFIKGLFK